MTKELIDFIQHCFEKKLIDNDTATVLNYETEIYKAINSKPQNESPNIRQNEGEEKFCCCAQGKGLDTDEDGILYCVDCGRDVKQNEFTRSEGHSA